ncbi:MAG: hypothetical protein R3Y56_09675 [Akkermansia sp.]
MPDAPQGPTEQWSSKAGVILAVSGCAIGFGNFLRFPGLAAEYGGGAFMVVYFIALFLLGIPLAWMEWTLGRHVGRYGKHSVIAAYESIAQYPIWKYLGLSSMITIMALSMYYLFIEGWTLGYTYHMLMGDLNLSQPQHYKDFFFNFTGQESDGSIFQLDKSNVIIFTLLAVSANIYLICKGISKGIEAFCKWSVPLMLGLALLLLIRVLTLGTPDATQPERNVEAGLGYMWNPDKTILECTDAQGNTSTLSMLPAKSTAQQQEQALQTAQAQHPNSEVKLVRISFAQGLLNPELWIEAVGQIFFSLSIGVGSVLTYASYVSRKEDIALSSLTANIANSIVEVSIAGMMIVPASICFLGITAAAGASGYALGFEVLPQVFAAMPAGQFFGLCFFVLLFISALASSVADITAVTVFLEDYWNLSHRRSLAIIITLILIGTGLVCWFTSDKLIALNTLDFFFGTLTLFIACTIMIIVFTRTWGTDKAVEELQEGALIKLPRALPFIMKWVTPTMLLGIFVAWLYQTFFEVANQDIQNIMQGKLGAILPLAWVLLILLFFIVVIATSKNTQTKS